MEESGFNGFHVGIDDNTPVIQVPETYENIDQFDNWLNNVYIPNTPGEFTECWGIFSKEGKFERYYHKKSYTLLTEEEVNDLRGKKVSHNHPSGHTFSYEDIKTWANLKMSELRVVTRIQKSPACTESFRYILKPKSGRLCSSNKIEEEIIKNIYPKTTDDFNSDSKLADQCIHALAKKGLFDYSKERLE